MANFTKTSKAEKIIMAILTLLLISGLVILFTRDRGFKQTDNPQPGGHLIAPKTD